MMPARSVLAAVSRRGPWATRSMILDGPQHDLGRQRHNLRRPAARSRTAGGMAGTPGGMHQTAHGMSRTCPMRDSEACRQHLLNGQRHVAEARGMSRRAGGMSRAVRSIILDGWRHALHGRRHDLARLAACNTAVRRSLPRIGPGRSRPGSPPNGGSPRFDPRGAVGLQCLTASRNGVSGFRRTPGVFHLASRRLKYYCQWAASVGGRPPEPMPAARPLHSRRSVRIERIDPLAGQGPGNPIACWE